MDIQFSVDGTIDPISTYPVVVHPGGLWMGKAVQSPEMEKYAEGVLLMGINHSMSKKQVMRRIKIKK
jgi:hypothetical protein